MRTVFPALTRSRLIELAQTVRRPTPIIAALIMALVFLFVGSAIFLLPLLIVVPAAQQIVTGPNVPPIESGTIFALELFAQFMPIILLIWAWIALWEKRPFWSLGLERQSWFGRFLRGGLIGIVLYSLSLGLAAALGYVVLEHSNPSQEGWAALGGVLVVALGWAIQGPAEEILCRGWLLQATGRKRPWLGVVLSSALFALLHSLNPSVTVLAFVNLFLFGTLACLYALREGGLWGICGLHAAWNWVQGNIFGIEVSGQHVAGGMLLNMKLVGPSIITGGAFGSEGGLAVTAVLLLAIAILLFLLGRVVRTLPTEVAQ
jgi:membrane protease YdiL (CAAX protease family)